MSKMIYRTMEKLIDMPAVFLLVTVLVFLAVVAALAAGSYVLACSMSKRTEMNGFMRVGVSLNRWIENKTEGIPLEYGAFWISMEDIPEGDSEKTRKTRLAPPLDWMGRMLPRHYAVSALAWRFLKAYQGAGLGDDPSAKLLQQLLEDADFCADLGQCCQLSAKTGLTVTGARESRKHAQGNQVSVYCQIDQEFLNCAVKTICVTLEYRNQKEDRPC